MMENYTSTVEIVLRGTPEELIFKQFKFQILFVEVELDPSAALKPPVVRV